MPFSADSLSQSPTLPGRIAPPATSRRGVLRCGAAGLAAAATSAFGGVAVAASPTGDSSFYANFRGLKLLDQEGRAFDAAGLVGRTVLVHFVYTGCSTVCPVQTRALAEVQRQLPPASRQRVHLLSISLDPLSDTPKALKAYALGMGADLSGWSLVTGRPADIERLSEALRLFRPGPDVRRPEDHATGLWLIDRDGRVRVRHAGNPPDVKRLVREIPALDALTRSPGA